MNEESSLEEVDIRWKGELANWFLIPQSSIPRSTAKAEIIDSSGTLLYTLKPLGALGEGTYGKVDMFEQKKGNGEKRIVALKRPNHKNINLLLEGLFQWKIHTLLKQWKLQSAVPEVYSFFRHFQSDSVIFLMECFEPQLMSEWCLKHLPKGDTQLFPLLLLQVALILEVFEKELKIDHRDLKIDNMLVVDQPVEFHVRWKGEEHVLHFPFRVVLVDFGFACFSRYIDIRRKEGLPTIDPCPKVGRDIFQVLVSLWNIETLRGFLEAVWGGWIREKIGSVKPSFVRYTEQKKDLDWMYLATDDESFRAPLCAPSQIIQECMNFLF